jgi:hypothetical protein
MSHVLISYILMLVGTEQADSYSHFQDLLNILAGPFAIMHFR